MKTKTIFCVETIKETETDFKFKQQFFFTSEKKALQHYEYGHKENFLDTDIKTKKIGKNHYYFYFIDSNNKINSIEIYATLLF